MIQDKEIPQEPKVEEDLETLASNAADALAAMDVIHAALGSGKWEMRFDPTGEMISCTWSDNFRKMIGYSSEEDFPNTLEAWSDKIHPDDKAATLQSYWGTVGDLAGKTTYDVRYRLSTADRGYRWFRAAGRLTRREDGSPKTFYGVFMDIDRETRNKLELRRAFEWMKQSNESLSKDHITGLMNRGGFGRYCHAFAPETDEAVISTMALDIANFNELFSQYGEIGVNNITISVASALKETGAALCYASGGRFLGLAESSSDKSLANPRELMDDIVKAVNIPDVTCKMAVFMGTVADGSINMMVEYAESTLNAIRNDELVTYKVVGMEDYREVNRDNEHLVEMLEALDSGEFDIYLQPKNETSTGNLVGSEALVRWIKPDGTVIAPGGFIPLMEERGYISRLDVYVWERAFQVVREWLDAGIEPPPISVNVSRIDIVNLEVAQIFIELSERYHVPPRYIEAEITESAYVNNVDVIKTAEFQLKDAGFHILIDDFGSGFSSLSMLKDIEADILKLDMGFLNYDENDNTRAADIIQSVLNMAHQLDMYVIVEGVETESQVKLLKLMGCQYAQGYYFAKPMPVESFNKLMGNASSSIIPAERSGSRKSAVQRLAECFTRVAEVDVRTGSYRFIQNTPEPTCIVDPRPKTIVEYFDRYVENGFVHPHDVRDWVASSDVAGLRVNIDKGKQRERFSARLRFNAQDSWSWHVIEIIRPEDFSEDHPWVLYTWKDAADDIADREDAEALVFATFRNVYKLNTLTRDFKSVKGSEMEGVLSAGRLYGAPKFVEDAVDSGFVHPDDAAGLCTALNLGSLHKRFAEKDEPQTSVFRILVKGEWKQHVLEISRSVDYSAAEPIILACLREAKAKTEEVSLENVSLDGNDELVFNTEDLLESIPGGFFVYEGTGEERLLYANGETLRIFGCDNMEEFVTLTGGTFPGMVHPEDLESTESAIIAQIEDNRIHNEPLLDNVSYRIVCKDGTYPWVQDFGRQIKHGMRGVLYSVFISLVPDARVDAYRIAHRMGITDVLCDMLNRNSFEHRKSNSAVYRGRSAACVFVDLNGLHELNNNEGHDAGDEALIAVANAVKGEFGKDDSFRIGGDEFVVLVGRVSEPWVTERIERLKSRIDAEGRSASVGYAYTDSCSCLDELVSQAELEMRNAKLAFYAANNRRR